MNENNTEKFPEGVLESIAQTISNYLSGTEIIRLLKVAGYPEKRGPLGTKWKFLYDLFTDFNNLKNGQLDIIKIIRVCCDPTRWINRETQRNQIIDQINEALIFVHLQVDVSGKILGTDKKVIFKNVPKEQAPQNSQEMLINPVFRERQIELDNNFCFVLMPFQPSFDRLFKDTIQPTVWHCGFSCARAKDFFSPKPIVEDIWAQICKSRVIIADVTRKNPNVFYEIGIAHTVGKPVIIITQDKEDVPFDVIHFRYFLYSDDTDGWKSLSDNIRAALIGFINRKPDRLAFWR